jgi:hypothetical protein
MKKILLLFLMLVWLTTINGFSQNSQKLDSTRIGITFNKEEIVLLRTYIVTLEHTKVLYTLEKKENVLLKEKIDLWNKTVNNKNAEIEMLSEVLSKQRELQHKKDNQYKVDVAAQYRKGLKHGAIITAGVILILCILFN